MESAIDNVLMCTALEFVNKLSCRHMKYIAQKQGEEKIY